MLASILTDSEAHSPSYDYAPHGTLYCSTATHSLSHKAIMYLPETKQQTIWAKLLINNMRPARGEFAIFPQGLLSHGNTICVPKPESH